MGSKLTKAQREAAEVLADRDWWSDAGKVLGLRLCGWSYRSEARFETARGVSVHLPGVVAERLHEIRLALKESQHE